MSWSIIIASASKEARLAKALNDAGYPAFLPLKRTWRTLYSRPSTIGRPVFPGYVFAVIQPQDIHAFHFEGASRILTVSPAIQQEVDQSILSWQIAERYGEFDDFKPGIKTAGRNKVKTRNRRTRRIKRLMSAIAEMTQAQQHVAA